MNTFLQGHDNLRFLTMTDNSIISFNHYMYKLIGIKSSRIILLLDILTPIIYVLNVIVSFFFFFYKFISNIIQYKKNDHEIQPGSIYLFFCNYFTDRCKSANLYTSSQFYVIMPGINHNFVNIPEKTIIDYKSYLTKSDAFFIYFRCLKCLCQYVLLDHSHCLIHKSWEYYELEIALRKLCKDCDLYFCNQSDKWALLFDSIPSKSKTLLQHGLASTLGRVPYRLKNISKFYSITKSTWKDAYENIFDCNPELVIMDPTIELYQTNDNKFRILIVADIIQLENEVNMLKNLSKFTCLEIYLKKHPSLQNDKCYRQLQSKYNFIYITEKKFPRVDFVISYYSTLAYEYMAYDIPVYMYMTKEEYSSDVMLKQLKDEMSKWSAKKITR